MERLPTMTLDYGIGNGADAMLGKRLARIERKLDELDENVKTLLHEVEKLLWRQAGH